MLLAIIGVLLAAALAAAGVTLYRTFYGPAAFVERYATLLAEGNASEALAVPGVAVDSAELEAAGLPEGASDALLRNTALGAVRVLGAREVSEAGGVVTVELSWEAGGQQASSVFRVRQNGMIGIAPRWEFARSPLAVMNLKVNGSTQFAVNGFALDKRQVSPDGPAADLDLAVPLLVFTPGLYSVTVDTPTATSPGVAMISDAVFAEVPVTVNATATDAFVEVVQKRVDDFLAACATQQVLQPTGCPFGYPLTDRLASLPAWQIVKNPEVQLVAFGGGWRIVETDALAHVEVTVRSLFDGRKTTLSEDVPFLVSGTITQSPDGTAAITLGGTDAS